METDEFDSLILEWEKSIGKLLTEEYVTDKLNITNKQLFNLIENKQIVYLPTNKGHYFPLFQFDNDKIDKALCRAYWRFANKAQLSYWGCTAFMRMPLDDLNHYSVVEWINDKKDIKKANLIIDREAARTER